MSDLITLVEKAVPAAITGIAALIASALSFKRRLEAIERDHQLFKAQQEKHLEELKSDQEKEVERLKRAFRLELDDFKGTVDDRIKELSAEYRRQDQRFSTFRESSIDFAREAELARFIEEQQTKWAMMQRTLGQIEGMVKKLP